MRPDELKQGAAVYYVEFTDDGTPLIQEYRVDHVWPDSDIGMFQCTRGEYYSALDMEPSMEEALSAAIARSASAAEMYAVRAKRAESALRALVGDRKDHCA